MLRRAIVALCLSGGGFRAALFHLGALRRLNELGILSKINAISSVSGGSIMSAHLAQRVREWSRTGDMAEFGGCTSRSHFAAPAKYALEVTKGSLRHMGYR